MDLSNWGLPPQTLVEGLRPSNSLLPRRRVAACGNFETGLFAGKIAAPYAQEFWLNLDDKTRRAMIWGRANGHALQGPAGLLAQGGLRRPCLDGQQGKAPRWPAG